MSSVKTLTGLAVASLLATGLVACGGKEQTLEAKPMEQGYQNSVDGKTAEGKCGEGKCGADKNASGACGAHKADTKTAEGKCGEGKCGGSK